MQLVDRVELCNGCGACRVACKYQCVKMKENEEGLIRKRDMAPIYRATMREAKAGKHVEFVGTLCQIAALKSLRGDKLSHNIAIFPVYCDEEQRKSCAACAACRFYEK